jgi:hypothetical protein
VKLPGFLTPWKVDPSDPPAGFEKHIVALNADELEDALKGWRKEEYKQVASQPYDLGKFLLGVSSGTITVTAGVASLIKSNLGSGAWVGFGLGTVLQIVAAIVAMSLVLPHLDETTRDIHDLYVERIGRVVFLAWLWGGIWLGALVIVTLALVSSGAHK